MILAHRSKTYTPNINAKLTKFGRNTLTLHRFFSTAMPTILNIETSTEVCSVALTAEGAVICHYEEFQGRNHATLLSDFIKGCLDHLHRHEMRLDAVAVSIGPGSYTGLRIGLSEAKGLAYALDVPLIGVDTLKIMSVNVMFAHDIEPEALFVPMIDARRMEVYTAVFDLALNTLAAPTPLILEPDSYDVWLEKGPVLFFGNGSNKAKTLYEGHCNAHFISDVVPLAVDMLPLADQAYRAGEFLELAYSVPNYLKEFQATKPRKLF